MSRGPKRRQPRKKSKRESLDGHDEKTTGKPKNKAKANTRQSKPNRRRLTKEQAEKKVKEKQVGIPYKEE